MEKSKKLNLGSGEDRREGYINIDWNELAKPDVIHDLNKFPYPFADDTFDRVEASHVLEHLDRPFLVMRELHRILKPGGELLVRVPHFSRGFTHAEHSHGFDVTFPFYFSKKTAELGFSGYFGVDFACINIRMNWLAFIKYLPMLGYRRFTVIVLSAANKLINLLANLSPAFCSRIWCYYVGGFEEIEFIFKKPGTNKAR